MAERRRGVTVKDVDVREFVPAYAAFLKRQGQVEVPKWVEYAKTAHWKETSPNDIDWYV